MRKWIWLVVVLVVGVACSSEEEGRIAALDICETLEEQAITVLESGLNVEGLSLRGIQAARSRAYEKLWFVSADIQGPGFEGDADIAVWAVDDLKNPEFIYWVNDRAKEYSNWGEEEATYSSSTDGIGSVKFCTRKQLEG